MKFYKYDTHVHTAETSPCGRIPGAELVHKYKDAGYDGIIITDHYIKDIFEPLHRLNWEEKTDKFLEGYRNAFSEGQKIGLAVLLGMEIRFNENDNDYLIYGFDEVFLKKHRELYKLGLRKFRELTKNQGILIYQAHPFRWWVEPADPAYLDGVEVFNGNPRHESRNDLALGFAKENNLKMTSGSDFHQEEDLARGGVILPEPVQTSQDWVRALRENKIKELIQND